MARAKLTKRLADSIKASGTEQTFFDTDLAGFYLRVSASGAKSYGIMYRNRARQLRRLKIATHGAMTPEQARAEAQQRLATVARGIDPAAESKAYRDAWTVADLAKFFRKEVIPEKRKLTRDAYERQLDRFIIPKLGKRKLADLSAPDIVRFHREVSQHGKPQANRVVRCLSSMFSTAIREGHRGTNPCKGVRLHPENKRERFLSPDELGRLLVACDEHPNQQAANLVRLLAMTGARKAEVLNATWDMFDLDAGTWTKPSHHTKQKKIHRAPLTAEASTLLTEMQAQADPECKWLFPGIDPAKPLIETKRPVGQIMKAAGFDDVTLHTLRHTFGSLLASSGSSLHVIGGMLGHTQANTTHRYAGLADSALRETAAVFDRIAGKAKADARAKRKADAAKVVSIASARR